MENNAVPQGYTIKGVKAGESFNGVYINKDMYKYYESKRQSLLNGHGDGDGTHVPNEPDSSVWCNNYLVMDNTWDSMELGIPKKKLKKAQKELERAGLIQTAKEEVQYYGRQADVVTRVYLLMEELQND